MRQFILPESYKGEKEIVLDKEDSNYLSKVLRLKINSKFKGLARNGEDYILEVKSIDKKNVVLTCTKGFDPLLKETQPIIKNYANLSLAVALLKGKKIDLIVKMATEIGVKNIYIFEADNSIANLKSENKIERLLKIRDEAMQQSGSRCFTNIQFIDLKDILLKDSYFITLHQEGNKITTIDTLKLKNDKETIVFVGPEGGFSDKEVNLFKDSKSLFTLLATNILRSETACIYSLSLLQSLLYKNT